ncbi:MAG TPA: TlpA disulfide reductase family protein [Candidatus Methylomirabilis sp.]|nr:TlpA disulfide reductase family protein [Candidatus Methylomirabilis sp.]
MRAAGKALSIFLLLACACAAGASPALAVGDTAMRLKIGDKAPDFKLKDVMTGKSVALSEFAGKKVVMLEFWATWCEVCKREMPNLVKLHGAWKDKGFELLSIVLPSGNVNDIKKIVNEKKLTYPVLLDADLAVATKHYGLAGPIPLKVVIDHKGVIRYTHVGDYPPGEDELPFVLEDLVKEMGKGK